LFLIYKYSSEYHRVLYFLLSDTNDYTASLSLVYPEVLVRTQ
jgi:hypothetical protein